MARVQSEKERMPGTKKERGLVGESVEMNVYLSDPLYGVERDDGEGCVSCSGCTLKDCC